MAGINTPGDDTVARIKAAKDEGYVVPPELMRIGDGVERAIARLPADSFARFLGWSYIISLADGGLKDPQFEFMARLLVLRYINSEHNQRWLRGEK